MSLVIMLKKFWIDKEYDQLIVSILSKLGPSYSVFVSTFHATRLVVFKRKIPYLNYFLDSLTKEKDKLIHVGVLNSPKRNGHSLLVQGSKKHKSKEKQIVKKPKSEIEDEDLMKKVKKKGSTSKCYYCSKVFINRRSVSRRIWTSCLSFLRSTRSKFQMN